MPKTNAINLGRDYYRAVSRAMDKLAHGRWARSKDYRISSFSRWTIISLKRQEKKQSLLKPATPVSLKAADAKRLKRRRRANAKRELRYMDELTATNAG